MEKYQGADAFIDVLNANGVESVFFNPGGEQALIQANIARLRMLGQPTPRLVLCLDESVAVTAAHGHYIVSGKPQVVMVHSELGTQQVGGAMHNAQWGRVPLILWAGLAPPAQRTNWKNESYDQGCMLRNSVKWDHTVGPDEDIRDVLTEAFKVAMTEPRGPVYLSYPRDIISKNIERKSVSAPVVGSLSPPGYQELTRVADMLVGARHPFVIAGYTARYPETIKSLEELAEALAAPVLSSQVYLNFRTTHALSAGIEQILGSRKGNPYFADADVVLAVDYDMPYAAAEGVPGPNAKIIQFDTDPLTNGRPLWGRGADLFVKTDSRQAIPLLTAAIRQKLTAEKREEFRHRFDILEAAHKQWKRDWRALGERSASEKPISPDWLCRCLSDVMDESMILVNHTISHSASVTEQIERSEPGTLLGCPAGSIQFALGAALGAKIAAPDRTVVSVMTDGGFVWGCAEATLWAARAYDAPFLAVVCDNQSYGFIHQLVRRTAGEGEGFSGKMAFEAGVDFVPPIDYAMVATACGAYGRKLDDPAEVPEAMREAMAEVKRGRAAVVAAKLEMPR